MKRPRREITCPATLTRLESSIFSILLSGRGRTVSRREILAAAWTGSEESVYPATVDRHISALRKKLRGRASISPVYGVGYRLELRPGPLGRVKSGKP